MVVRRRVVYNVKTIEYKKVILFLDIDDTISKDSLDIVRKAVTNFEITDIVITTHSSLDTIEERLNSMGYSDLAKIVFDTTKDLSSTYSLENYSKEVVRQKEIEKYLRNHYIEYGIKKYYILDDMFIDIPGHYLVKKVVKGGYVGALIYNDEVEFEVLEDKSNIRSLIYNRIQKEIEKDMGELEPSMMVLTLIHTMIQCSIRDRSNPKPISGFMIERRSAYEKQKTISDQCLEYSKYIKSDNGFKYQYTTSFIYAKPFLSNHQSDGYIVDITTYADIQENSKNIDLSIDISHLNMIGHIRCSVKYNVRFTTNAIVFYLLPSNNTRGIDQDISRISIINSDGSYSIDKPGIPTPVPVYCLELSQDIFKDGIYTYIKEVIRYLLEDYEIRKSYEQGTFNHKLNNINRVYFLNSLLFGMITNQHILVTKDLSRYNVCYDCKGTYIDDINNTKCECTMNLGIKGINVNEMNFHIIIKDTLIDSRSSKFDVQFVCYDGNMPKTCDLLARFTYRVIYYSDGSLSFHLLKYSDTSSGHLFMENKVNFESFEVARYMFYKNLERKWVDAIYGGNKMIKDSIVDYIS